MKESSQSSWRTVGHERAKAVLELGLASDQVFHAYCFWGPAGVGKRTLALEFADKLGAEPRLTKQLDLARLTVAEVREELRVLALSVGEGERQVAIFLAAERMSPQVAATLLKTLEEPGTNKVFILIASGGQISAALRSRCQLVRFGKLTLSEVKKVGQSQELEFSDEILALSRGNIGLATAYAQKLEQLAVVKNVASEIQSLAGAPLFKRLALVSKWAAVEPDELEDRLVLFESAILGLSISEKSAARLKLIHEARRRLRGNGNKKMVMEYICLNF